MNTKIKIHIQAIVATSSNKFNLKDQINNMKHHQEKVLKTFWTHKTKNQIIHNHLRAMAKGYLICNTIHTEIIATPIQILKRLDHLLLKKMVHKIQ